MAWFKLITTQAPTSRHCHLGCKDVSALCLGAQALSPLQVLKAACAHTYPFASVVLWKTSPLGMQGASDLLLLLLCGGASGTDATRDSWNESGHWSAAGGAGGAGSKLSTWAPFQTSRLV